MSSVNKIKPVFIALEIRFLAGVVHKEKGSANLLDQVIFVK